MNTKEERVLKLAENCTYDMDSKKTGRNNHTLIVGASGSGKTRHVVEPNLVTMTGSYVISDPKGALYQKYASFFRENGYEVSCVDFIHPEYSNRYNFFDYIHSERDILKIAHILCSETVPTTDPFWDYSATTLASALISYLLEACDKDEQTIRGISNTLSYCYRDDRGKSSVDYMMEALKAEKPKSFAVRQYTKVSGSPEKTFNCILATLNSKLAAMDCQEIEEMNQNKIGTNFAQIGEKKTVLFVIVSDSDRSMDRLASMFFTQAIQELCLYADTLCQNQELHVPVTFILDDFATNVEIVDFPRMISAIRSRGINVMLAIQSEAQLENVYGKDGRTIISNCDNYIYLGGNDIATAENISRRCNRPLEDILEMPIGTAWIFRRGERVKNEKLLSAVSLTDK